MAQRTAPNICRREDERTMLIETDIMGMQVAERASTWHAQPHINSAQKMPSADGELHKSLLRLLLGRKKYGKMHLKALRNMINI